jgi:hypothetical protein
MTFDEDVCNLIKNQIKHRNVAQLMVLTFRKALGLIVNPEQEALTYKKA